MKNKFILIKEDIKFRSGDTKSDKNCTIRCNNLYNSFTVKANTIVLTENVKNKCVIKIDKSYYNSNYYVEFTDPEKYELISEQDIQTGKYHLPVVGNNVVSTKSLIKQNIGDEFLIQNFKYKHTIVYKEWGQVLTSNCTIDAKNEITKEVVKNRSYINFNVSHNRAKVKKENFPVIVAEIDIETGKPKDNNSAVQIFTTQLLAEEYYNEEVRKASRMGIDIKYGIFPYTAVAKLPEPTIVFETE